jgi:hypothetical protein
MTYRSLPVREKHEIAKFIQSMNASLAANADYVVGMVIATDGNGYWLEYQGSKLDSVAASGILSQCHKAVLERGV